MEDLQGGLLALEHYYEIEERTARDALGLCYKATQKPLARPVSVWTLELLVEMGAPPALLERLKRIVWRTSHLSHPSTLQILDYGRLEDRVPFLVTERVSGVTLQERIASEGPLSPRETLKIIEQLQSSLDEAYRHLVFHGALDTSRVLFTVNAQGEEQVKLTGYGMGLTRSDLFVLDHAMFTTNLVRHLPPEAFDGPAMMPYERQALFEGEEEEDTLQVMLLADVYGLAAIAYECLTGMHPYFRDDRGASDGVLAMLRETPPSLADYFTLSEELDEVIMRGLAQDPEERFENPAAFVEALREVGSDALDEEGDAADEHGPRRSNIFFDWLVAIGELTPQRMRHWLSKPSGRRAMTTALVVSNLILFVAFLQVQRPPAEQKAVKFIPPAAPGQGVDLMFLPTDIDGLELHVVAPTGETASLGAPPLVLRNQEKGARLGFVVTGLEDGRPTQFAVSVRDGGGQVMYVDTQRWLKAAPALHSSLAP